MIFSVSASSVNACMVVFGLKEQDPDYMEPSRHRPRLDYSDPAIRFRTPHYRGVNSVCNFLCPDLYGFVLIFFPLDG